MVAFDSQFLPIVWLLSTCQKSSFLDRSGWKNSRTPLPDLRSGNRRRHNLDSSLLQMRLRVGILGLPNVGKSTLFNSLAKQQLAASGNFPFCTIQENIALVPVPSRHLADLRAWRDDCNAGSGSSTSSSTLAACATMQFTDVAGLVKGAHRGEGLGNRFLATLRECHSLVHVVRAFPVSTTTPDGDTVVHVKNQVDPLSDATDVNLELLFADLDHVQRRLDRTTCTGTERDTLERIRNGLEADLPARAQPLTVEEELSIKSMGLLTLKPVLYAFNTDEADFIMARDEAMEQAARIFQSIPYGNPSTDRYTIVSAQVESDMTTTMSTTEQQEYMEELGMEVGPNVRLEDLLSYTILPSTIRDMLEMPLVYTGPGVPAEKSNTVKSHLLSFGTTVDDMAGRLHKEIQTGFLRAEVVSASDMLHVDSFGAAKDAGMVRTEGKEYVLQEQDVVLIKWKG